MQDAANTGFTAPHSPAGDRFEREGPSRPDRAQAPPPLSPAGDTDLFVRALGQFQEIQAATAEPQRLWRALMTICVVAALLGVVAGATFYYTRSDNVLADLLDSGKLRARQILPTSAATEGPAAMPRPEAATSMQPTAAASASAPAEQARGAAGAEQPPPLRAEASKPKLTRSKSLRPRHKVAFRSAFGHVVTTRTYASKAMKRKALALWDREGKILEPNGTVSVPYKKPTATASEPRPIPGH